jgi:pilus assembly protein Flp/PilA
MLGGIYGDIHVFYQHLRSAGAISQQFDGRKEEVLRRMGIYIPNETGRAVMKNVIARFANDESGATAIEYGLIAAIVGVGIIVGLEAVRDGLKTLFNNVNNELTK